MNILPGLEQFRGYRRDWLRGDLLAGLTVAAYLVPQVMAYATVAGLPPVVGLWAALVPLAVYAVLGSSRQLSVGPESTTALMTATALAPLARVTPPLRRAGRRGGAARRRDLLRRGPAAHRLPGRSAVATGAGRLHDRGRGDHDRQPARQGHRRLGGGRRIRRTGAVVHQAGWATCTGRRSHCRWPCSWCCCCWRGWCRGCRVR